MDKLKFLILVSLNSLVVLMENILSILVPNNTELLNYSLKLIIIRKNVISGHLDALLPIFSKTKLCFIVNPKLICKYWEGYSD